MNTVEILKAARELISDEKRWTKGAAAKDSGGEDVPVEDPSAVCFCSIGALSRVYRANGMKVDAYHALVDEAVRCRASGVADFNDTHTHAEVLALFDRAIARAEGGAA